MKGMARMRIPVGFIWPDGTAEKLANAGFPTRFATAAVHSGGYVSRAPSWFEPFVRGGVARSAGLFAGLRRAGESGFGLLVLFSTGSVSFCAGPGPPQSRTTNLVVALFSLVVLFPPKARALSPGRRLAGWSRALAILLSNRKRPSGHPSG